MYSLLQNYYFILKNRFDFKKPEMSITGNGTSTEICLFFNEVFRGKIILQWSTLESEYYWLEMIMSFFRLLKRLLPLMMLSTLSIVAKPKWNCLLLTTIWQTMLQFGLQKPIYNREEVVLDEFVQDLHFTFAPKQGIVFSYF